MKNEIRNSDYYVNLLTLPYEEACEVLKKRHGELEKDYTTEKRFEHFKKMNPEDIRTESAIDDRIHPFPGFVVHHIMENQYLNLSSKKSISREKPPYSTQKKENLVLCDPIEHFILHYLIAKETNGEFGWQGAQSIFGNTKNFYKKFIDETLKDVLNEIESQSCLEDVEINKMRKKYENGEY